MRKTIALTFILIGILVFSVFNTLATKAITLEEVQAQIQQLLQAINSLKVQIQTMNQTSTSVQSQPSTSSCPFVSLMYRGYSEEATTETTELQKLLKQDSSVYPEGLVTGYFGRLTEAAVQRFQAKYGIRVTGQVGPETRAKLCSFWQGGISIGNCGWCGNTCVRKTTGMYCAAVMPPTGYDCKEVNGVCQQVAISQTQLPDLTITDLTCSPNNNIQLGQSTQCNITIHNSGSVDAHTHKLEAFVGGRSAYSVYGIVSAGQTEQATFSWQCAEAGDFTVKAVVDSENIIQESNETNNEKTISICCGGTCTGLPTSNLPDLTITDITSDKGNIYIGQTQKISATEKNIGTASAGAHSSAIFGDDSTSPVTGGLTQPQTLLNGYGFVFSGNYTCTTAGYHTLTVKVDYLNQVQESNESNNNSVITVYCLASSQLPDLTITTITYNPIYPTIGQNVNFYVNEKNIGNATAGYHYIECFENNISVAKNIIPNELAPNATGQYSFIRNYTSKGTLAIKCKIDSDNRITESNETNNESVSSITIASASTSNLLVACVSSKTTNTFNVGESLALFALPTGGSGSYPTAVWSGDVTGTGLSRTVSFSTAGTKTATVKVTDSNGATATASCSVLITVSNVSIYPTQIGCIKSPAYNEDACSGYRLIKTLNYSAACYSLSQCLAVQGDGTCVKSPVYQGDTCSGYRLMSGVSRNCYTYDQCLTANQASFLESLRIQLAQINELVKKLTASLIEMNR
jgi:hypothetical protein